LPRIATLLSFKLGRLKEIMRKKRPRGTKPHKVQTLATAVKQNNSKASTSKGTQPAPDTQQGQQILPTTAAPVTNQPNTQNAAPAPNPKGQPAIQRVWSAARSSLNATTLQTIFIGITALVTTAYAITTMYQWKAMKGQLEVARDAVSQTREQFKQDQRPYI
jgi:hypothetical protein